jgi:hypothetical protein
MGNYLYFTHRDVERVKAMLKVVADAALAASEEAVYALQACRLGDLYGLYGRDLFLRAPGRRRLARRGLTFADDPFVRFTEAGTFTCDDLGEFRADFVLLFDEGEDPKEVIETKGALLPFRFASFRLGRMKPDELTRLSGAVSTMRSLSARDEDALVRALFESFA